MPKKKKESAGRYSEIVPGLFLGSKDAVGKMMESSELELIAVLNIGGGQSLHANTLKYHIKDSRHTSMYELFEKTCEFLDTYCQIVMFPLTPKFQLEKEINNFNKATNRDQKVIIKKECDIECDPVSKSSNCKRMDGSGHAAGDKDVLGSKNASLRTNDLVLNQDHIFKQETDTSECKIKTRKRAVLVHCRHGMHRSPTIVCAYLIHCGYRMDESLEFISERRSIASPTPSQQEDLKRWEQFVSEKNARFNA